MKAFHEEGEYDIFMNREHYIAMEFKMHGAVLGGLLKRTWELRVIESEDIGSFVTSDRPVILTWTKPEEVPLMHRDSPGNGMPDTEVIFPLTKDLLLVGTFEGKEGISPATDALVAEANLRTILSAYSQVFGPKKSIPYLGPDGQPYHDAHFMERWEPMKRKPEDAKKKA